MVWSKKCFLRPILLTLVIIIIEVIHVKGSHVVLNLKRIITQLCSSPQCFGSLFQVLQFCFKRYVNLTVSSHWCSKLPVTNKCHLFLSHLWLHKHTSFKLLLFYFISSLYVFSVVKLYVFHIILHVVTYSCWCSFLTFSMLFVQSPWEVSFMLFMYK